MSVKSSEKTKGSKPIPRILLFPVLVLVIYGILLAVKPEEALLALRSSSNIFLSILRPLGLVFVVMLVLNLFVKPAQVARFLGKGASIKAIMFSVAAGIISMGPIYVWYPLLKELREKGAGNIPIAIFLYNRAVKPFLLPVMIAYFGWVYVGILTILTVLASIAIGYSVSILVKGKGSLGVSI